MLTNALLLAAAQAHAAETRTAPEGHVPPPATVAQLDWLAGIWAGEGIGGAKVTEVYSPPGAGSVGGHFVQEDGKGGVEFFEIMQIAEVGGSLVYRLKHFSNQLAGWEEKDQSFKFRLTKLAPGELVFGSLAFQRTAPDTFVFRITMRQKEGPPKVSAITFRKKPL